MASKKQVKKREDVQLLSNGARRRQANVKHSIEQLNKESATNAKKGKASKPSASKDDSAAPKKSSGKSKVS